MLNELLRRNSPTPDAQIEHERLTSLINSMADGVIAVNKDMRIVTSNGAALNILDVNSSLRNRLLGSVIDLIDKNSQPIDVEKLVASTATPTSNRDLLLRYQDKSLINIYLSIAPVHIGYGQDEQHGYVILLRDITREKSLEEERDEFISVVSHELRTPIAIAEANISNAQFILEKSKDLQQIKDALKHSHEQVLYLADLINDLSTLSRAERGKLNIEPEEIDVKKLVEELGTSFSGQAKAKGLELKTSIDPELKNLESSMLYVHEVLQNFVTNAIKYTEKGSVTLAAEPAQGGVNFKVSDTGIGISRADQTKIFDKFFRSEDFRTRKNSGTGLGLYVCMKLAKLIHAEIEVKSVLNQGSTFTIFIPNIGK
jgi:two-component system sensor histidine kinase ResE